MAVATWQKSTARRLVSVIAAWGITNPMLFGLSPAVTSVTGPSAWDHRAQRGDHVGLARQAGRALDDGPVRVQDQDRRGAVDPQPLTRSIRAAASISTWVTPSTMSATWARICRVGRHGAQKAVEN